MRRKLKLLLAGLVGSVAQVGSAATQYWDGNGTTAGAGAAPAGVWGISALWNSQADGTDGGGLGVIGSWTDGDSAVFSAGTDAGGSYTVTVSGVQSIIGGVNVEEGTPTFSAGTLDMTASGATVGIASSAIVSSVLTGGRLTKTGVGTLTLGAVLNQPNTFTGGVTLNGGMIVFQGENSGLPGNANALGAAPGSPVSNAIEFSNGATLRSMRSGTTAAFVLPNRGVQLNTGGGAFDVAVSTAALGYAGDISGSGPFVKRGPGELRLTGANPSYTGGTVIEQGTLTLGANGVSGSLPPGNVLNNGVLKFNRFDDVIIANPINGAGGIIKTGSGATTLTAALTYWGVTQVNSGRLILQTNQTSTSMVSVSSGALELADGAGAARVLRTASVSITGSGKLDLRDNKLITPAPIGTFDGFTYDGITGMLASGYNAGAWDGNGIVTSQTSATNGSGYTTLAVATASESLGIAPQDTATWSGQTVTGSDTLVMYTYGGDANLDGKVDVDDYGQIDLNASTGGLIPGYFNGDFNFDGVVSVDDFGIIDFTVNIQGPPFPTSAGAMLNVASVPEPAASLILMTLGATLLRRRNRR